jgi:hypothetical protein
MTVAFVLGNGVSRRNIDLARLKQLGPVYGCNALYRDFAPDCLVATDRPIAQQIQESGYSKRHRFYTRKPIPDSGAFVIPQQYYTNSSGPIACAIAASDGHNRLYMLGYDMGPDNQRFNNVYAGTDFYKSLGSVPTFTGNWVKQIAQVCRDFSNTQFIRVVGESTAEIVELKKISNLIHLPLHEFVHKIRSPDQL